MSSCEELILQYDFYMNFITQNTQNNTSRKNITRHCTRRTCAYTTEDRLNDPDQRSGQLEYGQNGDKPKPRTVQPFLVAVLTFAVFVCRRFDQAPHTVTRQPPSDVSAIDSSHYSIYSQSAFVTTFNVVLVCLTEVITVNKIPKGKDFVYEYDGHL